MAQIKGVFVYSDYPSISLSIPEIINYLRDHGLSCEDRGNFFEFLDPTRVKALELARRIAGARVLDITSPLDGIHEPTYEEIDLEISRLTGKGSFLGVLYDGFWLQRILYKNMAVKVPHEFRSGFIHVIFTSRLFGTYETSGSLNTLPLDPRPDRGYPRSRRYHARVILTGLPSLISTSGIVEAPARPKEYYWLKAGFIQGGKDVRELDLIYKGRFIEYDDPRITRVLRPYILQAIFYELTGNPFCDNPSCCLYNSHWQEEVLKAQLEGKLCEEHRNIIFRLVETT